MIELPKDADGREIPLDTVAEDASWRGVTRRIADPIECGVANRVETMCDTYRSRCGRHLDMEYVRSM